jgi:hypothetical protein
MGIQVVVDSSWPIHLVATGKNMVNTQAEVAALLLFSFSLANVDESTPVTLRAQVVASE